MRIKGDHVVSFVDYLSKSFDSVPIDELLIKRSQKITLKLWVNFIIAVKFGN